METWQPQETNTDTAQEKQVQKLKREDPEGKALPPVPEFLIPPLPSFSPLSAASFSLPLSLSLPSTCSGTHTRVYMCMSVQTLVEARIGIGGIAQMSSIPN